MLNKNEISDLASDYAWNNLNIGDVTVTPSMEQSFISGYKKCEETIPSECIGFAEWITLNSYSCYYIDGRCNNWEDENNNKIAGTTEELYSIYLESLKQKS